MYKSKKSGLLGTVIIIGILILMVIMTNANIDKFSNFENVFCKIVAPLQNGLAYLKNKIYGNDSFFENMDSLKQQNEELQKQLDDMCLIETENKILREYSKLEEYYSEYETIGAYIINKNTSNLSDTFVINIGKKQGVETNMAVVGRDGLVGYVISTTSNTAKIQPIIDVSSSVSGLTSSTRINVKVDGQVNSNNELKVYTLQVEDEIIQGDTIETSGLGGIYPKGIKIGTVKRIVETKNATEKYAILETEVDFENLEYVLVIKNK